MVVLVVSSYGTKIGRSKELFKIQRPVNEFQEEYFPAEKVEEIIVETTGSISFSAIKLASRYSIPILFLSNNEPIACINPFVSHGSVQVRRAQMLAYELPVSTDFSIRILKAATTNKIKIIKNMLRNRKLPIEQTQIIRKELQAIDNIIENFRNYKKDDKWNRKIDDTRGHLFAKEAEIAKRYYHCLTFLLNPEFDFKGRTRQPPRDSVNALLSYAYIVLTSQLQKAILVAGLEPYAGFMHTDRSGKPSFVLDMIEIFRQPVVDRLVFTLVNKEYITPDGFKIVKEPTIDNGTNNNEPGVSVMMKDDVKKLLLEKLYERIRDENVKYLRFKTSYSKIFVDQARKAGQFLMGLNENYEPFTTTR